MSSIFLFLYGECVYQMIEMYILAYLVHMYKCQSTSLSKDACVRDGDELKSFCMHVCVCVSVCLEDCSKSRPLCVLRLFHQTSSLDLLEPSAKIEESNQVKRSMKKNNVTIKAGPPSNARSRISSKSAMPSNSSTSMHPILLCFENMELGCYDEITETIVEQIRYECKMCQSGWRQVIICHLAI